MAKSGNRGNHPYPAVGSRWLISILGISGEVLIIGHDRMSDGRSSPYEHRAQFEWEQCSDKPTLGKYWSRTLDRFYQSKPKLINAQTANSIPAPVRPPQAASTANPMMPNVGDVYVANQKNAYTGSKAAVTGIHLDSQNQPRQDNVQMTWLDGPRKGTVGACDVGDFYHAFDKHSTPNVQSPQAGANPSVPKYIVGATYVGKQGSPYQGIEIRIEKDHQFSVTFKYLNGSKQGQMDHAHIASYYMQQFELSQSISNPQYPEIGSMWMYKSGASRWDLKVTSHDTDFKGRPAKGSIQYKWLSGPRQGKLDSIGFKAFNDPKIMVCLDQPSEDEFAQEYSPAKQRLTNDGLDTCRFCGAPTKVIGCFPGSKMRVCTKCKR